MAMGCEPVMLANGAASGPLMRRDSSANGVRGRRALARSFAVSGPTKAGHLPFIGD